MLLDCVRDIESQWNQYLLLCEFSYNNIYNFIIDKPPFETLYVRRCRSLIWWFDIFDVRPWGTDMLKNSIEK